MCTRDQKWRSRRRTINERRMRHATREGNKPSFWTYISESERLPRLSEAGGRRDYYTTRHTQRRMWSDREKRNYKYREDMRKALEKCKD
eukprot:1279124-Pleurochrysis_carterae.AAC.3